MELNLYDVVLLVTPVALVASRRRKGQVLNVKIAGKEEVVRVRRLLVWDSVCSKILFFCIL